MFKVSMMELQAIGRTGEVGETFETDLFDLVRRRYRVCDVQPRFALVEKLPATPAEEPGTSAAA